MLTSKHNNSQHGYSITESQRQVVTWRSFASRACAYRIEPSQQPFHLTIEFEERTLTRSVGSTPGKRAISLGAPASRDASGANSATASADEFRIARLSSWDPPDYENSCLFPRSML